MRRIAGAVSSVLTALVVLALAMTPAWGSSWSISTLSGSAAQSQARQGPAAPATVTATCNSIVGNSVIVTWTAAPQATSYTVYQATAAAGGPYTVAGTVGSTTSWTSGALGSGSYWFEVTATIGTSWTGPASVSTSKRKINGNLVCS